MTAPTPFQQEVAAEAAALAEIEAQRAAMKRSE